MNNRVFTIITLACVLGFGSVSCKDKEKSEEEELSGRIEQQEDIVKVKAVPTKSGLFETEIASNGKAEANKKAVLTFKGGQTIMSVNVENGERINKGDILTEIDPSEQKLVLASASENYEKAKLDLLERLLSEGVTQLQDTVKLDKEKLQNIKLRSGFTSVENQYRSALQDYNNLTIKAPFSGVVADCDLKPYNPISQYDKVCTLIDDSQMEITFNVMESEVKSIAKGMPVLISPYIADTIQLQGVISQVNPKIDNNGMVKVKATVNNNNALLVDGMNVSVLVRRATTEAIIIPKSAVLPRQGRKVVFTLENGRAIWKYVTVSAENSTECAISEGLTKSDIVIYENNLGLSHDLPVTVEE